MAGVKKFFGAIGSFLKKIRNAFLQNSRKIAIVFLVVTIATGLCVIIPPAIPAIVAAIPGLTTQIANATLIGTTLTAGAITVASGATKIAYAAGRRDARHDAQAQNDRSMQVALELEEENEEVGLEIADGMQQVQTQNVQIASLIAKIEKMESDNQIRNDQDMQTRIADAARIDVIPELTARAVVNLLAENPHGFFVQEQNQHINNSRGAQPRRKIEPQMGPA